LCKAACKFEVNLVVANLKHFIRKFIAKLVVEFATNLQVGKFIANLFFRPVQTSIIVFHSNKFHDVKFKRFDMG
jgi:ABC-type sulfate transport system substrate-binding protein